MAVPLVPMAPDRHSEMIIRPASLADVDQLVDMALIWSNDYPHLKPDKDKIRRLVINAISSAKHYASVVVCDDGKLAGALVAFTVDNAWAQRQHAFIMFWVSYARGKGALMLRQFRDWVLSRRAIKVAGFAPDIDVDPRVWQLAERIGFKRHGGAYLLYN